MQNIAITLALCGLALVLLGARQRQEQLPGQGGVRKRRHYSLLRSRCHGMITLSSESSRRPWFLRYRPAATLFEHRECKIGRSRIALLAKETASRGKTEVNQIIARGLGYDIAIPHRTLIEKLPQDLSLSGVKSVPHDSSIREVSIVGLHLGKRIAKLVAHNITFGGGVTSFRHATQLDHQPSSALTCCATR